MGKNLKNILRNIVVPVVITVILVSIINIAMNGMPLLGTPKIDSVEKIIVENPTVTNLQKEYTDTEKIELGCKLLNFLNYVPFRQADENAMPLITITYILNNDTVVSVSANRKTVWWNGRAHMLKDDETFVNLTEGIFYLDDLMQGQ